MSLISIRSLRSVSLAALLAATASFMPAQTADSPEISRLLAEAKTEARLASDDAARLESFTRTKVSWQSHATQLVMMKEHVNSVIKTYNELAQKRAEASPWQQEAIDRIEPLLKSMSDHVTATIEHLNNNQSKVHMPPYQEYARGAADLAEKTHAAIRDFVDYGEARAKTDSLEQKLELPETSGQE